MASIDISSSYGYGKGYVNGDSYISGAGFGYGDGNGYSYGSGYGDGNGSGNGNGNGYDFGNGRGEGNGSGNGYAFGFDAYRYKGYGNGFGNGCGIKQINGIYGKNIDGIDTFITSKHKNIYKGFVWKGYLKKCFVVEQDGIFAHGDTIKGALQALRVKILRGKSDEERIAEFWEHHNNTEKYPVSDFYEWHHLLTDSCEFGRKAFFNAHGLTMEETHTVKEFVELVKNDYGGDTIMKMWRCRGER